MQRKQTSVTSPTLPKSDDKRFWHPGDGFEADLNQLTPFTVSCGSTVESHNFKIDSKAREATCEKCGVGFRFQVHEVEYINGHLFLKLENGGQKRIAWVYFTNINMNDDEGSNSISDESTFENDSPSYEADDSQASESEVTKPGDTSEQSDDTSSEDNNTPSENTGTGEAEGEKPVGLKGQQRFQKLANENRQLSQRETFEQSRESRMQQLEQVGAGQQTEPNLDPYAAQMILNRAELARMKEERELEKASRKHPELNADSDEYDKDFHDAVWNIRRSEGITYDEAAFKQKRLIEKYTSKAASRAETEIAEKSTNSARPQQRTRVASSSKAAAVQSAYDKFKSSGDPEDWVAYQRAKRG